jgi:hypothetical protein
LDHLILKPKQLDGITAVYVDVVFGHLAMALSKTTFIPGEGVGMGGRALILNFNRWTGKPQPPLSRAVGPCPPWSASKE